MAKGSRPRTPRFRVAVNAWFERAGYPAAAEPTPKAPTLLIIWRLGSMWMANYRLTIKNEVPVIVFTGPFTYPANLLELIKTTLSKEWSGKKLPVRAKLWLNCSVVAAPGKKTRLGASFNNKEVEDGVLLDGLCPV